MASTPVDQDDVLARLAAMQSQLDGVSSGDTIETPPQLTVIRRTDQVLVINEKEYDDIWLPDFHTFRRQMLNKDWTRCEAESPSGSWSCTGSVDLCSGGFSHIAAEYTSIIGSTSDQILEIWSSDNDADAGLYIHRELIGSITVPDFTKDYRDHYGSTCRQTYGPTGYICTLHAGHPYSHCAGNKSTVVGIWT